MPCVRRCRRRRGSAGRRIFLATAGGPPAAILIDSSAVRAHRCAAGGKGGERSRAVGRSRNGRTNKVHAMTDGLGRPVAVHPTGGQVADCRAAGGLVNAIRAPKGAARRAHEAGAAGVVAERGERALRVERRRGRWHQGPTMNPVRRSGAPDMEEGTVRPLVFRVDRLPLSGAAAGSRSWLAHRRAAVDPAEPALREGDVHLLRRAPEPRGPLLRSSEEPLHDAASVCPGGTLQSEKRAPHAIMR